MTDGEALRHEVVARPADDTLRLIYADWLDENGRPDRAAFIRAQVEAAQAEPFGPVARAAAGRAENILRKYRRDWTRHLDGQVEDTRFVRGFVEHVTVEASRLAEVADTLFDLEPVRSVQITRYFQIGWLVPLEPVFDVPRLRQVTALHLPAVGPMELEWMALLRCPHLEGLKELSLRHNPLQPAWVAELLTGPYFPELTALDLSHLAHVGPAFREAVEKAPHRRFTRLNLSGVALNSGDLQRVLASACLREVEELRLGWAGGAANPGAVTHLDLSWVLPWQRLRLLDLAGQGIGPEGVRELVRQPRAAQLRWLGLAANGLGPADVAVLVGTEHLNPYHLDMHGNGLAAADLEQLRARFPDAVVVG